MAKKSYKEFIDSKKEELLLKKKKTNSVKKSEDEVEMTKKEFVKEHKNLVEVLRSGDKKKQKKEAKDQKKELQEVTKKSAKDFAKDFKKSYDFRDTRVSIDAKDQAAAETTACPKLVKFIKNSLQDEISKIPLEKGVLTLSKKEEGLYNGFFEDRHGQIVEKFDDVTVEIVAKTLEVKNLFVRPAYEHEEEEAVAAANYESDEAAELTQEVAEITAEEYKQPTTTIKIKCGDVELEIRKSINNFVNDFRKKRYTKNDIKKSIKAWSRNYGKVYNFKNEIEAAEELSKNWEENKESFFQVLHNLQQFKKSE